MGFNLDLKPYTLPGNLTSEAASFYALFTRLDALSELFYTSTRSHAKNHALALKHLHRESQGDAGINTGRAEDHPDVDPMPNTGKHLLTDEAEIENRHQRKFRVKLDPWQDPDHRGHEHHKDQR